MPVPVAMAAIEVDGPEASAMARLDPPAFSVRRAVWRLMTGRDLDNLSLKGLRRDVEASLGRPEGHLASRREEIKEAAEDFIKQTLASRGVVNHTPAAAPAPAPAASQPTPSSGAVSPPAAGIAGPSTVAVGDPAASVSASAAGASPPPAVGTPQPKSLQTPKKTKKRMTVTGYRMYLKDHWVKTRNEMLQAGENPSMGEVTRIVGDQWKMLSAEEQKPYEERAVQMEAEMAAGEGRTPPGSNAPKIVKPNAKAESAAATSQAPKTPGKRAAAAKLAEPPAKQPRWNLQPPSEHARCWSDADTAMLKALQGDGIRLNVGVTYSGAASSGNLLASCLPPIPVDGGDQAGWQTWQQLRVPLSADRVAEVEAYICFKVTKLEDPAAGEALGAGALAPLPPLPVAGQSSGSLVDTADTATATQPPATSPAGATAASSSSAVAAAVQQEVDSRTADGASPSGQADMPRPSAAVGSNEEEPDCSVASLLEGHGPVGTRPDAKDSLPEATAVASTVDAAACAEVLPGDGDDVAATTPLAAAPQCEPQLQEPQEGGTSIAESAVDALFTPADMDVAASAEDNTSANEKEENSGAPAEAAASVATDSLGAAEATTEDVVVAAASTEPVGEASC
eukprot:TRINITY_DN102143_c0_g1_i1.p1 TRINITY_DN102143_c0_g1~~TRINITY_DN102143_c0_g1_i1.p1  ORF type:complete len:624 (-),score=155.67 TRINITY_DN102143_c0_g1_i1:156-2027(-)